MTELRRTNRAVGVLRAEREFHELRSNEFVLVAIVTGNGAGICDPMFVEAPPL